MPVVELPPIWLIVVEAGIGIVIGEKLETLKQAQGVVCLASFVLSIASYAYINPNDLNNLTIGHLNDKITTIMYALVNWILHVVWMELGATPTNLIRHPPS